MIDDPRAIGLRRPGLPRARPAAPTLEPRPEDDHELMARIARRDASALARLYDRHAAKLHAICIRIVGTSADAEEILGDVFWEVWRRPERYDPKRAEPAVYLIVLARSRALDRVRQVRRRWIRERNAEVPGCAAEPTPLESALRLEARSLAARALAKLGPEERRLVELSFLEGLTHREIAERAALPLGTIKTRIRRSLIRLREMAVELGESE